MNEWGTYTDDLFIPTTMIEPVTFLQRAETWKKI